MSNSPSDTQSFVMAACLTNFEPDNVFYAFSIRDDLVGERLADVTQCHFELFSNSVFFQSNPTLAGSEQQDGIVRGCVAIH